MLSRYSKYIFIFILLTFNLSIYTNAQENEKIRISSNKISLEGMPYYIHKVESGNTLYSLSKAYGVDEQEIIKSNPGVEYGLQLGQNIKIPIVAKPDNKSVSKNDVRKNGNDSLYIYHITEPGETTFSLSKIYKVSEDTILALNPGTSNILKSGAVIKIPRINYLENGWDTRIEEKTIKHYVRKGENLISIARKYNVPFSNITKNNQWGSIKEGNYINVAIIDTVKQLLFVKMDSILLDTQTTTKSLSYFDIITGQANIPVNSGYGMPDTLMGESYHVALLLPFKNKSIIGLINKIDTCTDRVQVKSDRQQLAKIKSTTDFYLDFYLGTLLALDSLKKTGAQINYNIFDTEGDTNIVRYIINKNNLNFYDLVIGPTERASVRVLLEILGNTDVKIVLPTVGVDDSVNYSNIYKVYPSEEIRNEHTANYIASKKCGSIIVIYEPDSASLLKAEKTISDIKKYRDFYFPGDTIQLTAVSYRDSINKEIKPLLHDSLLNTILVLDNESFVSYVLMDIYLNIDVDYDISVVGNSSWVKMFDNLDIEYLHDLKVTCCLPFYLDYKKENVIHFMQSFRDRYRSEPSYVYNGINALPYGYDLMMYFASPVTSQDKEEGSFKFKGLISDYEFVRMEKKGMFENISVTFISFDEEYERSNFKPYNLFPKK